MAKDKVIVTRLDSDNYRLLNDIADQESEGKVSVLIREILMPYLLARKKIKNMPLGFVNLEELLEMKKVLENVVGELSDKTELAKEQLEKIIEIENTVLKRKQYNLFNKKKKKANS